VDSRSLGTKCGSTILLQKANTRVRNGKHPTLPGKKKFKTQPSVGKVMTLYWDAQGPILEHCQERGTTVNSVCYSEMLQGQLGPAIQTNAKDSC
jgi:hypothetical protein